MIGITLDQIRLVKIIDFKHTQLVIIKNMKSKLESLENESTCLLISWIKREMYELPLIDLEKKRIRRGTYCTTVEGDEKFGNTLKINRVPENIFHPS